jgi:hypothetical protein
VGTSAGAGRVGPARPSHRRLDGVADSARRRHRSRTSPVAFGLLVGGGESVAEDGGGEPEDDGLVLRYRGQRLESAGALVVVLEEEPLRARAGIGIDRLSMERAPGVVDGFQQWHDAGRGRHVVDEVPAGVAVGPVQPPSRGAVTQSREGTGGPLRAERCVGGVPGHPAFHQDHVVAADLVF